MQVQVQARERPRLFSGTAGQDIAAARVVGFACVGALLHQLRTPRNTWGGAAAAQAAADVLLEEEERERARARAPAAPAIAAPAPAPPADEDRAISSAEASTAPEAPREAEGESGALVALPAEDEQLCRFCFGGADEMPGGLISPCQCKGTQAFVHLACLRGWQTATFRARGVPEHSCRVCHSAFALPPRPVAERVAEWFRPRAADRLAVWSAAWTQILANTLVPLQERRVGSLRDVGLILAASEVRVWGSRELRRGRPPFLWLRRLVAATEMAQFGAVGCWALAVCGAFLGDFLTDLERAALGGGEGVVAPLLLPVFSGVSKARGGGQTVLTLPLRAFVRFGEPLYHVVQFVERFPQFRL